MFTIYRVTEPVRRIAMYQLRRDSDGREVLDYQKQRDEDRNALAELLRRYGPALIVAWVAEMARAERP